MDCVDPHDLTNTTSTARRCLCKSGYEYRNDKCSKGIALGATCSSGEVCVDINAECKNSKCTCRTGFTQNSVPKCILSPTPTESPTSKGCYEEDLKARKLNQEATASTAMTTKSCTDYCTSFGYKYAGIQARMCYCGEFLSTTTASCNMTCVGKSTETCGDSEHVTVYDIRNDKLASSYASWSLNAVAGSNSTGAPSGVTASLTGSPTLVTAYDAKGLSMTGTAQYATMIVASAKCINSLATCTDGFTFSAYFKFTIIPDEDNIYVSTSTDSHQGFTMSYIVTDTQISCRRRFAVTVREASKKLQVVFDLETSEWVRVVITWTPGDGLSVYVDDFLVSTEKTGDSGSFAASSATSGKIDIGKGQGEFIVDNVKFIDRGLKSRVEDMPANELWVKTTGKRTGTNTTQDVSGSTCRTDCLNNTNCFSYSMCYHSPSISCWHSGDTNLVIGSLDTDANCEIYTHFLPAGPLKSSCYKLTDITSPVQKTLSSTISPALCRSACNADKKYYALIIGKTDCYCYDKAPSAASNDSSCSLTCEDGSKCGGNFPYGSAYVVTSQRNYTEAVLTSITLNVKDVLELDLAINNTIHLSMTPTADSRPCYSIAFGDGATKLTELDYSSHTYTAVGSYDVTITGHNDQNSFGKKIKANVYKAIGALTLTAPPYQANGESADVTIDMADGTNATCVFANGDGTTKTIQQTANNLKLTYQHTYTNTGQKTIDVTCSNPISSQKTTSTVFVQDKLSGLTAVKTSVQQIYGRDVMLDWTLTSGTHFEITVSIDGTPNNALTKTYTAKTGSGSLTLPASAFTQYKKYAVVLTASNNVSTSLTATVEVDVVHALSKLTLSVSKPALEKNEFISIQATITGGYVTIKCDFKDGTGESSKTISGDLNDHVEAISHAFTVSGYYDVVCKATDIFNSPEISDTIQVMVTEGIKDLKITKEKVEGDGMTMKIVLSATTYGTGSCFIWDFGDGSKKELIGRSDCKDRVSNPDDYTITVSNTPVTSRTHTYSVYDAYTVNVTGLNIVANAEATATFLTDNDNNCQKPTLTQTQFSLDKANPTQHPKSELADIKITVGPSCDPIIPLTIAWTLHNLDTGKDLTSPTSKTAELSIPGNTLPFSNYEAKFSVYPVKALSAQMSIYFRIVPSNLVAVIYGGDSKTSPQNSTLNIDGSKSQDPDTGDATGLSYEWYCAKNSEVFPETNGKLVTTMPSGSSGGCEGKGPGRVAETKSILTFAGGTFSAGTVLKIRLVIKKDSREAVTNQEIKIISTSVEISINCKLNCDQYLLIEQPTTIAGACDNCDATSRTQQNYKWQLYKKIGGAESEVGGLSAMTVTGVANRDIALKANQLDAGSAYVLKFSINDAFSKYNMKTPTYPSGGQCISSDQSGTEQETKFSFKCFGYGIQNFRFTYVVAGRADAEPVLIDEVLGDKPESRVTTLPAGLDSDDHVVNIKIRICNTSTKACSLVTLPLKVYKTTKTQDTIMKEGQALLSELSNSKDTPGLMTAISVLAQGMKTVKLGDPNSQSPDSDTSPEEAAAKNKELKKELVTKMTEVTITEGNVNLVASALKSVSEDTASLDDSTQSSLVSIAESLASNPFVTNTEAKEVAGACLSLMATVQSEADCDNLEVTSVSENSEYNPKEELARKKEECLANKRRAVESSQRIKKAATEMMTKACSDLALNENVVITSEYGVISGTRRDPAQTNDIATDASGGSFQINLAGIVSGDTTAVDFVTITTAQNTETSDPSAEAVKTQTQSLSVSADGQNIPVNNLSPANPITIVFPAPPVSDVVVMTSNLTSNKTGLRTTTVEIKDPQNPEMILFIKPDGPCVIEAYGEIDKIPSVTDGRFSIYESLDFTSSTDQQKLKLTSNVADAKDYYLSFNVSEADVNFTYTVVAVGCLYFNKTEKKWMRNGLSVNMARTNQSKLVCESTHLTEFGGSFFVPPNKIDFSTLFQDGARKAAESAPVIATVCGVIVLYLLLLLLMRRLDKRDVFKWATTPLSDNTPVDMYHYHMTVYTSPRKGAGTKSNVFFMLAGESGDTEVRKLEDTKKKELSRGSVNNYLLSHPRCLGPLLYMRIWHDNSGQSDFASWHLDRIVITDIDNDEKYVFLCDRWMAVDMDDGQLERLVPAASRKDLENFQHLFYTKTRQDMTDGHLWFSLVSRPTRSRFTRVQRLSCCMALLYATMIANAMWFRSGDDTVDNPQNVKLGPFVFSPQQLYISIVSSLVSVPVTILIVYLFRKAGKRPRKRKVDAAKQQQQLQQQLQQQRAKSPISDEQLVIETKEMADWEEYDHMARSIIKDQMALDTTKRAKKLSKQWPWWVVIVAYLLVAATVLVSAAFTIFYSMEWGGEKSTQWLVTFLLSFIQSVVIIQPIKVIALAVVLSLIVKRQSDDTEEDNALEDDEIFIEEMVDRSCHPEKYVVPEHRVPFENKNIDPEKLETMRKRREKEVKMFEMFREVASYLLYVLVICIVSYDNRDMNAFSIKKEVQNLLVTNSFTRVRTRELFWEWAEFSMVPALYKTEFYNGDRCKWRARLFMDDLAMMRVGAPRIRQLRVKEESCKVPPTMVDYSTHCYGEYGTGSYDDRDYGYNWQPLSAMNATDPSSAWRYRTSSELDGAPIIGQLGVYGGGGYVAEISSRPYTALQVIRNISRSEWFDSKTRAIFIEANLYNPNVNLFCIVNVIFELSPTGGGVHTTLIKPLRLYNYVGTTAVFRIIVEFLFAVFTLYFIIIEGKKMKKEKKKYFTSFWNIMELIIIILSVTTCALYGMHYVIARHTLNKFQADRDAFTNFQYIVYWDEMFGYVLAFTVFLVMIKTLRVLRFNKTVTTLIAALRVAAKPLASFFLFFTVIFCAFAQFGYYVFGRHLRDYSSFISTLESLFSMMMMVFNFRALQEVNRILGPFFLVTFALFIIFVTMNMLVSIINESFYRVQINRELISDDYEVIDFMMVQFKKMLGMNDEYVPNAENKKIQSSKTKVPQINTTKSALSPDLPAKDATWQNPITYELYKY